MEINIVYERMLDKLKKSNKLDIITEFKECGLGGVTGGEVLGMQASYLKLLREKDPSTYKIIHIEAAEILNYFKRVSKNMR